MIKRMQNKCFFSGKKFPLQNARQKAFTLMEVVVGAVIIALVFGGLTAIFVNVRHYVFNANRRLVAANLARETLNNLYVGVTANPNDPNAARLNNANNPHNVNFNNGNPIDHIAYNGTYNVTGNPNSDHYQEVTIQVTYPRE